MFKLDIQAPGLEKFLRKLTKYGRISERRFTEATEKSVQSVIRAVVPLVPVGVSARLKNSIASEVTSDASSIIGRVGSSLSDEEYPRVMEFGRRPGASGPPWEALVRWVHLKKITGSYSVSTHRRVGGKKTQQAEDEQAARMIARAIHSHGIKGRHYMRDGLNKAKSGIPKHFRAAAKLISEDLMK